VIIFTVDPPPDDRPPRPAAPQDGADRASLQPEEVEPCAATWVDDPGWSQSAVAVPWRGQDPQAPRPP